MVFRVKYVDRWRTRAFKQCLLQHLPPSICRHWPPEMAAFFVPKGKDGLILCSPLAYGLAAPTYESNAKATFRVSDVILVYIYTR